MHWIDYIKTKPFWKQLGLMVLLFLLMVAACIILLKKYTRHGKVYAVPELMGVYIDDLDKHADSLKYFNVLVVDSVYMPDYKTGQIVHQDPPAGAEVKKGRKIYVTVASSHPESVEMPNLVDLSLRQASSLLETYGLKVGQITYVPDFANNAVFEQRYKGQPIQSGTEIPRGVRIDLVVGRGNESSMTEVPFLIGKSKQDVIRLLSSAGLNLGTETNMDENADEKDLKAYSQSPKPGTPLPSNMQVDIIYRSAKKVDFKKVTEEAELQMIEDKTNEIE